MFGLGGWEILLLVVAGLLFFGPQKLPQLMRQAGKIAREVKKASNEFQYSLEREIDDDHYRRAHRRAKRRAKVAAELGVDPEELATPETSAAGVPYSELAGNAAGGTGGAATGVSDGGATAAPDGGAPTRDGGASGNERDAVRDVAGSGGDEPKAGGG